MDMAWIRDAIGSSVSTLALVLAISIGLLLLWFPRSLREQENKQEDEEGDIAWILKVLNSFQASFNSLPPARTSLPRNNVKKLNDYIYELCKPSGRPSVEIVFFHGFQVGGSTETFVTTWLARNGSELWLNWITEPFPDARILLVSYDASVTKKSDKVCLDMYITCENLVQSLTDSDAGVGQDGCPVILVGHSLGGLIIKEILLQANRVLSLSKHPNERVLYFFENVKQVFYYSCPHHGTMLAHNKTKLPKGPLFKLLTILNKKAARLNEDFRKLREKFNWGAYSISEGLPTDLGSHGRLVIVKEASNRHDTDKYYTADDADHFSVCQPPSRNDTSFRMLLDVIDCTVRKDVRGHQIIIPTDFVGLNDQINRIQRKLKTTKHVGICGIGGIGKSTLAKAVYNAISGNFEYTSFVSEVKKSVGKKASIEDLQAEILRNLHHKGRKCDYPWERLEQKRVLIILDDVECESQIFVMPETEGGVSFFSAESCVLVTSRNRRIVSSKDFEVYDAEFLDVEASRKLFCQHAFKKEHAPRAYQGRVEKFTSKCGGLPLALEVAGKYLYKQAEDMWDDAFTRLSAAKPFGGDSGDDLWSIFEIIYKSLQEEEREMFLDIATCFHGGYLHRVKQFWCCCDWLATPNAGWQNLVDIGFVRAEEDFYSTSRIWMHEMLRDFGYSKANPGSLESHTRICYKYITQLPTWPFKQGTPAVKILIIEGGGSEPLDIHIETLSGLKNLKVLWLEGVSLHGELRALRRLEIDLCEYLEDIPGNLGQLQNLQHLRISRSFFLEALPNMLGQLQNLQHLHISMCPKLKALPNTLGQLQNLWRFILEECNSLEAFPENLGRIASLVNFQIRNCWSLRTLPNTIGQLQNLRQINLEGCESLEAVPENLGRIASLENLQIRNCWSLRTLPNTIGQLQNLRQFILEGCGRLEAVPENLGRIASLENLQIRNCWRLRTLPNTIGQLQNLRQFILEECDFLEAVPENLGRIASLENLQIRNCQGLRTLPNTIGQLQNLRQFILDNCQSLEAVPENLGRIASLENLQIRNCQGLRTLPNTIGQLQNLRQFILDYCQSLEAVPENLGRIASLENLQIKNCWSLETLPNTIGQLRGLRRLDIENSDLETLPDTLGDLEALEHLAIDSCFFLRALPDTLGKLPALRQFRITGCNELEALPHGLWKCPALERLVVKRCRSLKLLPARITELRALPHFEIDRHSTFHDSDTEGDTDGEYSSDGE